jgi:hypothetical protein
MAAPMQKAERGRERSFMWGPPLAVHKGRYVRKPELWGMRHVLIIPVLLFALFSAPVGLNAQAAGISAAKQEKMLAKKEKKDVKEVKKKEKQYLKEHMRHQDKATQKRMKRHKRRSDKNGGRAQRDPWPQRWFTK